MKSLKVLMLNGSPHANGNTAVALREMEAVFKEINSVKVSLEQIKYCQRRTILPDSMVLQILLRYRNRKHLLSSL